MPLLKTGLVIPSGVPLPPHLTHGQGLVALYMLQQWESFAGKKVGEPYAAGYFYNNIHSVLHGLTNPTRKTAMGHLGTAACIACGAPVDLLRTEGDHLIARAYGGPDWIQNTV